MLKTITKYVNEEGFEFILEPIEDTLKIIKTKEGYEARYLIQETDCQSPRDWDNIGHMFCSHREYELGDKDIDISTKNFNGWSEIEVYLYKEMKAVVVLPLWLYDHSGISMAIIPHGQHRDWDCGQVGFIYATKEDLKREGITKARAEKNLRQEVETYNQYLTGDCYCLVKETYDKDKNYIDHDTLGGCYGYEEAQKSLDTEI